MCLLKSHANPLRSHSETSNHGLEMVNTMKLYVFRLALCDNPDSRIFQPLPSVFGVVFYSLSSSASQSFIMYSYLFFALSASYITQAKIEASLPSLGLCDSHGLDSLFNPICSGVRGSSTSPELQWLDERPGLQNSRRPAEQVTVSTHPVNKHPEWSHKPRCITQENSTKAYCAYTSHQFARGRGISIWDTPENIERVLALPAFTNQNVFDGVNEEPNPPYLAKELPGRGIGLIANRTLHRGDRIFSNTPVLLINQEASKTFVLEDRLPIQHTATQRLPQKARSAFLALCGHFGGDHIEDVLNTNSFAVDMKIPNSGHEYSAVFPEISVHPLSLCPNPIIVYKMQQRC